MTSTRIALSSLLLCLISACGGGGGGGGGSSAVSSATTIAGTVIDGYIEGAIVCLDLSSNAACDANEPTTTTGSDGKYSINYAGTTAGLHVLSLIPSTAKDADDKGLTIAQAGKTAFTLMASSTGVPRAWRFKCSRSLSSTDSTTTPATAVRSGLAYRP